MGGSKLKEPPPVERADVWVIQTRNRLRFTLESLTKAGLLRPLRGKDFDGDDSVEPGAASGASIHVVARRKS